MKSNSVSWRKARALTAAAVYLTAMLPAGPVLAADHIPMSGPINLNDTKSPGVPGTRTCFWELGPFGGNPYLNIAWPDTNTHYWGAKFTTPEGAKLELEGQFPHSRYSSFTTYDMRGQPVESLADYLIEPIPGHTNPARQGGDRTATKRSFSIEVLPSGQRDASRDEGFFLEGKTAKVIHAPKNEGFQQVLFLRVYTADKGRGIAGGVPLPAPVLTLADGKVLRGMAACEALNAKQLIKIAPDAVGMPAWRYRELLNSPGKPDTNPATNPATWYAQFERAQYEAIFTGAVGEYTRKSEGFYPTVDNNYMRTFINRKFGVIYVMRGKLPKTPKTMNGDPVMDMKDADMRYWSMCSQNGSANTMVLKCLNDEEMVTDKDRNYTLVVSRAADRPRTAFPECGVNWLPMPDDGDGMYDADQGNLLMRNQLAKPDFPYAIQGVKKPGDEKSVMGPYLPASFYVNRATFEGLFPCKSPAEMAKIAKETADADAAQQAARKAK